MDGNLCVVSVDSSGDQLHKRGYKLAVAKAPIPENVAAALLMAANYDPKLPLIDPMCGSGNLLAPASATWHLP